MNPQAKIHDMKSLVTVSYVV